MHSVKLILTDAQLRKMQSLAPFQLSHNQLSGRSQGKHEVTIQLPESDSRRLVSNVKNGKGFRFHPNKISGGTTYRQRQARRARNTFRKVKNTARDVGKFVAKNIPKDLAKDVVNLAIDELDVDDKYKKVAKKGVERGIDKGYASQGKGYNHYETGGARLEEQLKRAGRGKNPWISHVKRVAQEKGVSYRDALKHPDTKASYQRGGSFLGDIGRAFRPVARALKPVAKAAVPLASEIGKDVAKDAIKDAILGAGHGKSKQNIHTEGGQLLHGIPKSMAQRRRARERIHTNGLMHGGSFLPLGE